MFSEAFAFSKFGGNCPAGVALRVCFKSLHFEVYFQSRTFELMILYQRRLNQSNPRIVAIHINDPIPTP